MKFSKLTTLSNKSKTYFVSLFLICGLLLNSFSGFTHPKILTFFLNPNATITASSLAICKNETAIITFTGLEGTEPYTFTYQLNTDAPIEVTTTSGNSLDISLAGITVGDFTYKLTNVENSEGNNQTITDQEITVKVNPLPIVNFTFNNNASCSGEAVNFTNTSTGLGNLTYNWDFGDGKTSALQNPTNTFEALGCGSKFFNVKLTVTDENGCSASNIETISVAEKPDIQFRDKDTRDSVFSNCNNASPSNPNYEVTVENISNSTCIDSFSVDWGDGSSSSSVFFPATHTYNSIGVFDMKIRASGDNNCVNEVLYIVKNVGNPAAGFSSPGNTTNLCIAEAELNFGITNYQSNSNDTSYTLDFGDGSPLETYSQSEMTDPLINDDDLFSHKYEKGSCLEENGQFIATLSVQNACGTTQLTADNITILEPSVAKFESTEFACINDKIVFIDKSIVGNESNCVKNADVSWDFGDGTIIKIFSVTEASNIEHQYTNPGIYTVELSVLSKCNPSSFTKEICIEPEIKTDFSVDIIEGCIPLNVNATNTTDQSEICSAPIYIWTVDYSSDNCGSIADWDYTNGTDSTSENPQFIFNSPGKYTLNQKVTSVCGTKTVTKIIDVKKPPTASIQAIEDVCGTLTINPEATLENCSLNTAPLIYNWTFTGGSVASSNTLNPGNIEYTVPGIYEITLEVTNDCGISSIAKETFELFEIPNITNTNLTEEICDGQSTSEITLNSNNSETTYTWSATVTGNISGFITNGISNTIPAHIIRNTGNNPETVTYTTTPSLDACVGTPVNFIITVNPSPIINTQPVSSEICLDGTPTLLEVTYINGAGAATYQWFSNTTDATTSGSAITGETGSTYTAPGDTLGTVYYYVEISFNTGGCSQVTSNTASVVVNPQITVNPIADPQTLCVGGLPDQLEVIFSDGTGIASYKWYSNTTNSKVDSNEIIGEINSTYTPSVLNTAGSFYYYAEISLDGNGCNAAFSDVFEITVLSDPIINKQPLVSQELCQGAPPYYLDIDASGGTDTLRTYQWYVNSVDSNTGGEIIPSETTLFYKPQTTTVGTFYYYIIVSQPESGCSVASDTSQLIVNTAPSINTQPVSSEICLNGTPTLLEVTYTNGAGAATYQWFSNTTDATTSGSAITGETGSTYTAPGDTLGTVYYYVEISFNTGGCSQVTSNTASVVVNPQITVNPIADPQTLCVGGLPDQLEVIFSDGTGIASYKWYSNTTNSKVDSNEIIGEINSTYTPSVLNTAGSFYYYAEISLDGNGCNAAFSDVFEITVLSDPIINKQPLVSQELCQGAPPYYLDIDASGGTDTLRTYQWYVNSVDSNTGGEIIPSETTLFYKPQTTTVGTFYYYIIVSQPESGCSVASDTSQLIVNAAPSINTQPVSSEICLDGTPTLLEVTYTNGAGAATYQWFSNTTDAATGGSAITGETGSIYTAPGDTLGTVYYYVEISFNTTGGCSQITSNTASVVVNEIPVINDDEITIYSKTSFNFDPSTIGVNIVPVGTKYTWSNPTFSPTGSIIGSSAETTPKDQISQTLENTGTTPIEVTYIITPVTTKCTGNEFTIVVTVNPSINSNALITNNTCFKSNDGLISTNINGGIPFETGNPYLISWIGPNGFTSTDTTIVNIEAGLYILEVEDKEGYSIREELTVTEPAILSISKDVNKNISCFGGNDGAIAVIVSGGTLPYTYNWSTTNGSGIIQNTQNQNALTPGSYTLEVTDKNNCISVSNYILTEPAVLKIDTIFKQDILCFSEGTGSIQVNISGGTPSEISPGNFDYFYNWTGPNGYTSSFKNINNLFSGNYTLTITDSLNCVESKTIVLNQFSEILIDYTKTDVTCYGKTDGTIEVTVSGGNPPYQISWNNLANGFSLSDLSANTYIATITDGNNCTQQQSIEITQPIFFSTPIITPISCNNENDGSIDLNLTDGIAPISVSWSDDLTAGSKRNNISPGSYTVTILDSDADQCPIIQTFIFTNPPLIAVSSQVDDALDCDIVNSGSIDITVSGGTAPYTFTWSNGEITEDLINISPGDYSVEIKDENNCIVTKQFSISRQEPLDIELIATTIPNCDLKTVSQMTVAKVTGGFLPYTYSWSAGSVSTTDNTKMVSSQNGAYTLTITDNKGCTKRKIFLVDLPSIGNADYSYTSFSIDNYNLLSIEDPIQFTNLTTGNYSNITWDFGDGSPTSSEENPIHSYNQVGVFNVVLKIELDFGCIEVIEKTLNITKGYVLITPNAFSPNNDGYNETIRPSFRGFKEIEMTIYDTWGVLIYYEKNLNLNGWDGKIKGLPAENGNYVMLVKGRTFYKKEINIVTAITLLI